VGLRAGRAHDDFFQAAFRGFQLGFAMCLQRLATLVQRDGVLKVDLALFQAGNNGFQFLQRAFEAEFFDGLALLGGRNGGYSTGDGAGEPETTNSAMTASWFPKPFRAPALDSKGTGQAG
jgi:hypothetical protein